ncbi:MAG: hypothetical protein V1924_00180 [Candidatus Bathyarchaeota archaeon]
MKKYTKSFVTGSGEPIAIDMDKSSVRMMDVYVYELEGKMGPGKDEVAARESSKIVEEKRNALKALHQNRQQDK